MSLIPVNNIDLKPVEEVKPPVNTDVSNVSPVTEHAGQDASKEKFSSSVADFIKKQSSPFAQVNQPVTMTDAPSSVEIKEPPKVNAADFSGVTETELNAPAPVVPVNQPPVPEKKSSLSSQTQAKLYVASLDGLVFGAGLTFAHKKKCEKKIGAKKLEIAFDAIEQVEAMCKSDLSDFAEIFEREVSKLKEEEQIFVKRALKFKKVLKTIRMTAEEKQDLIAAFTDIIEENGGKMPAWAGAALAVLGIAVPRIVDLWID